MMRKKGMKECGVAKKRLIRKDGEGEREVKNEPMDGKMEDGESWSRCWPFDGIGWICTKKGRELLVFHASAWHASPSGFFQTRCELHANTR